MSQRVLHSLASSLFANLVGIERGSHMMLVHLPVVITGAGLVSGTNPDKTHCECIDARLPPKTRNDGSVTHWRILASNLIWTI